MEAVCTCGKNVTLPTDHWGVYCSSCEDVLLCPVGPGRKYIRTGEGRYHHVWATDVMKESNGNFYVLDDKVVETRSGQEVYGTIRVEGIVKKRLEELTHVRTTLAEKETAHNEALGKVKDCQAKFGRQMASMITEMTNKEEKIQAVEDKAKKMEEELGVFKEKEKDKMAEKEEMAREIKGLQEALSTANDKLEDVAIMTAFRRQESLNNEQLLTDQKTSFLEYKQKMNQEMEEQAKFYQEQLTNQEKTFLEQKDELQKGMEGQAKLHEQQMAEQERTFLEKEGKIQKEMDKALGGMRTTLAEKETALGEALGKVKEMEKVAKHYKKKKDSLEKKVEEMAFLSATNAKLERQNEIYLKMMDKMTENAGLSKAKDSEKTVEREKGEGRVVIGDCEKMEEEV